MCSGYFSPTSIFATCRRTWPAGGSSGFLQIQAEAGDGGAAAAANGTVVGRIAVPIEWSEVPEDAQYRVALKLQRVSWRLDC